MTKKILFAALSVVLTIFVFMLVADPAFRLTISKPAIRNAWQICRSTPADQRDTCYEKLAIEQSNPDICWAAGGATDDHCMQSVFEATNDPKICGRISKAGVKILCEQHFHAANSVTQ